MRIPAQLVALALTLAVAGCAGDGERETADPVNVVLISADTLRADRLGCYGYASRVTSPNIDSLAADAVLFSRHAVASPWTTPSHVSLLTSLFPASHGVTQAYFNLMEALERGEGVTRLADEHVTLAEALAEAGYATAAFTGGGSLDPSIGFEQGFEQYDTSFFKIRDENMARMKGWIDDHADRPFFLFWHSFEIHAPYVDTTFLGDVVVEEARRETIAGQLERFGILLRAESPTWRIQGRVHELSKKLLADHEAYTAPVTSALYDGGILSKDRYVGELLDHLRRSGLYDRTLVIFTSDHGEEFADHYPASFYDAHGHSLFEELVRTPLIVKLPGSQAAGTRVDRLVSSVDVMPTILDLASVPGPRDRMEGASLRPLWEAPGTDSERMAFSEALNAGHEMKSIQQGPWKYIAFVPPDLVTARGRHHLPETVEGRLFNLERDPGEQRGTVTPADDPVAQRLEAELRAYVAAGAQSEERTDLDEEALQKLRSLGYVQ